MGPTTGTGDVSSTESLFYLDFSQDYHVNLTAKNFADELEQVVQQVSQQDPGFMSRIVSVVSSSLGWGETKEGVTKENAGQYLWEAAVRANVPEFILQEGHVAESCLGQLGYINGIRPQDLGGNSIVRGTDLHGRHFVALKVEGSVTEQETWSQLVIIFFQRLVPKTEGSCKGLWVLSESSTKHSQPVVFKSPSSVPNEEFTQLCMDDEDGSLVYIKSGERLSIPASMVVVAEDPQWGENLWEGEPAGASYLFPGTFKPLTQLLKGENSRFRLV